MKDKRHMPDAAAMLGAGAGYEAKRLEILGHLAAGAAHELNNWIFVLRGFSELSRLDLPDGHPVTANLDRIEEAADQAEGLTRMILECAHPSGDGSVVVQLHSLVKEGVKLVRDSLSDEIRIHQSIATDTAAVKVDPVRLFPVIVALIRMAAEPLAADGGRLWVSLAETEAEGSIPAPSLTLTVGSATGGDGDDVTRRLQPGGDAPTTPLPETDEITAWICATVRDFGGEVRRRKIDNRGFCVQALFPHASTAAIR